MGWNILFFNSLPTDKAELRSTPLLKSCFIFAVFDGPDDRDRVNEEETGSDKLPQAGF